MSIENGLERHEALLAKIRRVVFCSSVVGIAVLWLSAVAAAQRAAEIIDRILAVVDGQVITLSDVSSAVRFGLVEPPPDGDTLAGALDLLIERELMLKEVNRYGPPEPPAAAIDNAIAAVRARFGSASQFATALAQSGLAEDQLRRAVRDDLRIRSYLDQRFAAAQTSDEQRRRTAIREWVASLRRRADVTVLYEPPSRGTLLYSSVVFRG